MILILIFLESAIFRENRTTNIGKSWSNKVLMFELIETFGNNSSSNN